MGHFSRLTLTHKERKLGSSTREKERKNHHNLLFFPPEKLLHFCSIFLSLEKRMHYFWANYSQISNWKWIQHKMFIIISIVKFGWNSNPWTSKLEQLYQNNSDQNIASETLQNMSVFFFELDILFSKILQSWCLH